MRVGTREEWLAARKELPGEENELTRGSDELARKRRQLPWGPGREPPSPYLDVATERSNR
jgi:predicted dithiol-disulfide oxidoreductase (DUF899 family)